MKDLNDRTDLSAVWSCTKQITAVLTGIAVDQGLISVNDPVSNHLPQAQNTNKSGITIENLLMMKSGINFNLNGGKWGTETIVSDRWIDKMTSPKVIANETHEANITFGYYWWGDSGRDLQIMRGQGGQYVFVNKLKRRRHGAFVLRAEVQQG